MKKFDITSVPVVNETKEVISIKFLDSKTQNAYAIVGLPVVIMAGGKGTRLYPYTQILPKPLLPIGELPIVEHIMNSFRGFSCEDFHLIVNHKKQMIKAYFADEDNKSKVSFYDEDIPLGTGGGLSLLKGHINETFFLTNCDIILKADYSDILEFHKKNHNTITIVCAYKHFQIPYGVIKMGDNGTIDEMVEKPEYSFLTNTGFYVVEPDVIASIKKDENISFPEIIENQIKNAKSVRIYPVSEKSWLDMGEFSQMEEMKKELGV